MLGGFQNISKQTKRLETYVPRKFNVDTKHVGLAHLSPASNMASFWRFPFVKVQEKPATVMAKQPEPNLQVFGK